MNTTIDKIFKDKVLGHPAGLFVLFFTEMWERFSLLRNASTSCDVFYGITYG